VYSYWANRRWSRCWDTTDAAVESVHSGEFPLHYDVDSFSHLNRNVDITKFLRVLLACGKCYAQNTRFTMVIIDNLTGHQRYVIDSTDTIIEQVQFTDSHIFFWKGSQKANCWSVYANEQSDTLLDRPWMTKRFRTWLTANPFSDKASPYPLFGDRRDQNNAIFGVGRGRTSINWPSNSREEEYFGQPFPEGCEAGGIRHGNDIATNLQVNEPQSAHIVRTHVLTLHPITICCAGKLF
jgi:hypothetical protein